VEGDRVIAEDITEAAIVDALSLAEAAADAAAST
jgi:hypothetical protein